MIITAIRYNIHPGFVFKTAFFIWGKERIMEVYLNVIETGKGLYGVQAAASCYFGTDAARLSER